MTSELEMPYEFFFNLDIKKKSQAAGGGGSKFRKCSSCLF